jgi:acetyl-CoA acetyltransferase
VIKHYRDAAVAGVYQTKQGDMSDRAQADVWWEVARGACRDAGLQLADIDGLVNLGPEGAGIRSLLPGASLGYDTLGKPLRFQANAMFGASSTSAGLNLAVYAVSTGLADVVVIVNATAVGGAKGSGSVNRDEAVAAMAKLSGPYEYVYGTTRVSDYATLAMRHMYEFGTTSEQLAEIAVAQRHGATLHPLSFHGHRGEITIDDVVQSRMIADPLHMLDCCAINQGAGALVVASADAVRANGRHPAIGLLGYGEGHSHIDPNSVPSLAQFRGAAVAADTAFGQAGISRDDIDVAGIGDHFTVNVLLGLEGAGFCKVGEGGAFVENGALRIGGRLPTNTGGGFLSFSHAGSCGLFSLIEVVEQLRNTAGPRQVANAKYGFYYGVGGAVQNNCAMVLSEV